MKRNKEEETILKALCAALLSLLLVIAIYAVRDAYDTYQDIQKRNAPTQERQRTVNENSLLQ